MQLDRVLKVEDLVKIHAAMNEAGYGEDSFEIILKVRSQEVLNKINEEFYYNGTKEGTPPEAEEVAVDVGNIKFKYVVEENVE